MIAESFRLRILRAAALLWIQVSKLADELLFLVRESCLEAVRLNHLLALGRGHLAQMAYSFVYCHLPVFREPFQLLARVTQLLALLRRELGQKIHALQSLVTLFRGQAVEFLQSFTELALARWWKLLELGIAFQEL